MQFEIEGNPDFGQLTVDLVPGESFLAEAGSMAFMSAGTELKSKLIGGFMKALVRKFVGGESLFVGEYSHPTGGSVTFSPDRPGMVLHRKISGGETFVLTAGSFLAATPGIKLTTKFVSLKAIFSGEGAFTIVVSGEGDLFFNSYGAIIEKQVDGALTVDTGHAVAWESGLKYNVTTIGGIKSTLLSGEGIVLNFTGTGTVFLQTRTLSGVARWLGGQYR
ncbi:MAG: TIGR00266 family protein [Chloroflexi bacterium]|nr:TIGR00266 family protein [Chloroflexota bacterium]